jgi:glycosyltransferase involved in cell wall biosynthesis
MRMSSWPDARGTPVGSARVDADAGTVAKTILVDLTPLNTESRIRGTGRYVRQLAIGLSRLSESETRGLRLVGLTRLGWTGDCDTTDDLASYEGRPDKPTRGDHYRFTYHRRVGLFRAVRKIQADLVHLGDPNATPLFMGLTRCKKLVSCLDLIPQRFPEHYYTLRDGGPFIGRLIEKRRYRSADRVVAISDATAADLRTFLDVPDERIVRVYPGLDVEDWLAVSTRPPDRAVLGRLGFAERPFVLYVGDGDWRKNAEGMVGGVARARARGLEVDLAWAGKLDAQKQERITAAAVAAGVADRVHLLGFVPDDDLQMLYRGALANLFVSRAEGFGYPVVEAMACGCPVITTAAGSLSELTADAAICVDPEDHTAIGDAIVLLQQDAAFREELIVRGKARAPFFSVRAQALAMVDVYRRMV